MENQRWQRNCLKCDKILIYTTLNGFCIANERQSVCKACSLTGRPCKRKMTREQFIARASEKHNNRYDYSQTVYNGVDNRLTIICPIHGVFEQTGTNHLYSGHGCIKCRSDKQRKLQTTFIAEAMFRHGHLYNYDQVEYKNAHIKVKIICAKHGEFYQSPNRHIQGEGCPSCCHKNEHEVGQILRELFPDWQITPRKLLWKSYKDYTTKRFCDFFLQKNDKRIVVEYDGEQHFRPVRLGGMSQSKADEKFKKQQIIDCLDAQFCNENGILLFRIKYNEDKQARIDELTSRLQ